MSLPLNFVLCDRGLKGERNSRFSQAVGLVENEKKTDRQRNGGGGGGGGERGGDMRRDNERRRREREGGRVEER